MREPQTHSSSRVYAGAMRAASDPIRPAPERASDFNALDTVGSLNHPQILAQQSIETCLLEERGDNVTCVSRVV